MVGIIAFIVFSLLVGMLGDKRKIGFGWSFVLSLFLSPIIGLIITLFSKKKDIEFVDINKEN
jgi:hypothetical protein